MTTLTPNTYTQCPTALIVPSLTNRKHFAPEPLQALSDNIKARGIDQPIIVRPLPGSRLSDTFEARRDSAGKPTLPAYEIVSGERRFRAACMAGLVQVPVILRVYNDVEAIEAQLIENMLRESLSELDEAEGFDVWLQQPGITTGIIAGKTDKSVRYVQSRLQLLKLQPETKAALRTNQIEVSQALLLAPVHDPKLQLKALEFARTAPSGGTQPSVRDLAVWLRQNVMLELARAPFQITDANLVPLAGGCKTCPKRTGADPDMFSHVDGADICTDPPCYNNKTAEHIANLEFEAKRKGMRLVHGAEANAICYKGSSTLNGYSPLSQVRNDLAAPYTGKRLEHLLSPSPAVPIAGAVLIENPHTRELIAAIPTAEAEAALVAKGLVKILDQAGPEIKADKVKGKKDVEADIERLKCDAQFKTHRRFEALARAALIEAITEAGELDAGVMMTSPKLWRTFLRGYIGTHELVSALENTELAATEDPGDFSDQQTFQAVLLFITNVVPEVELAFARENQINIGGLKAEAAAQIKAEVAAQIAALKKPAKPSSPKSPLAQPSTAPVADAENQKPKTAKPKAQAKLSAKDAQLGIADALQGIEAPPADGAVPPLDDVPMYAKGQHVIIKAIREDTEYWRVKYEGKTGKVDAVHKNADDEDLYVVTFKGRTGGVADFTADELEAA